MPAGLFYSPADAARRAASRRYAAGDERACARPLAISRNTAIDAILLLFADISTRRAPCLRACSQACDKRQPFASYFSSRCPPRSLPKRAGRHKLPRHRDAADMSSPPCRLADHARRGQGRRFYACGAKIMPFPDSTPPRFLSCRISRAISGVKTGRWPTYITDFVTRWQDIGC